MTENVSWRDLYGAAMLELDPAVLRQRIGAARAAIQRRTEELTGSIHDCSAREERQQIADALENMRTLERVEFKSSSRIARDNFSTESAAS